MPGVKGDQGPDIGGDGQFHQGVVIRIRRDGPKALNLRMPDGGSHQIIQKVTDLVGTVAGWDKVPLQNLLVFQQNGRGEMEAEGQIPPANHLQNPEGCTPGRSQAADHYIGIQNQIQWDHFPA